MGYSSGGGTQPIQYLFIDGGYLKKVIDGYSKKFFNGFDLYGSIDFSHIRSPYTRVFYYDCLAPKKKTQSEDEFTASRNKQIDFFNSLRILPGIHVKEGTINSEKNGQKQVDVMIAVDLLTHTIRQNMDRVTLLTGDLDFKPAIEALIELGMYTMLLYHNGSTNAELIYSADEAHSISVGQVYSWIKERLKPLFKLPQHTESNMLEIDSNPIIVKKGTFNNEIIKGGKDTGNEVFLYQTDEGYSMSFPSMYNSNYTILKFNDALILEHYIADLGYNVNWEV